MDAIAVHGEQLGGFSLNFFGVITSPFFQARPLSFSRPQRESPKLFYTFKDNTSQGKEYANCPQQQEWECHSRSISSSRRVHPTFHLLSASPEHQ
jgi:hypothetical protein